MSPLSHAARDAAEKIKGLENASEADMATVIFNAYKEATAPEKGTPRPHREMMFPVSQTGDVVVRLPADITKKEIDMLEKWMAFNLSVMKEDGD